MFDHLFSKRERSRHALGAFARKPETPLGDEVRDAAEKYETERLDGMVTGRMPGAEVAPRERRRHGKDDA